MEHEDNELRDFWGEETAEDRERIERVVKQAINRGYNPELNAVMHLNICNAGLVRPGPSQCLQSQAGTLLYRGLRRPVLGAFSPHCLHLSDSGISFPPSFLLSYQKCNMCF